MKYQKLLEKIYSDYERDNKIPRDSLCANVFQFFDDGRPPILHDSIKFQIASDLQQLEQAAPITNAYLIGEILTPYYSDISSIDVYVEIDPEAVDNLSTAGIYWNLNRINDRFATGTRHKIHYHLNTKRLDTDQVDAVYDIMNEKWIKRPDPVTPAITEIITDFNETMLNIDNETGKILRDKISIDEIRQLGTNDLQVLRHHVQQKFDALIDNLQYIAKIYPNKHAIQRLLNDDTLTTIEIQTYGQLMPEFIRIMFFKKYHYRKFIQRLDDMLMEEDEFDIPSLIRRNPVGRHFKRA